MTIRNFEKVDKYLYRSGKLKPIDIMELKEKGIKKIISLDEELGSDIAKACKELKIQHEICPIDIYDNKSVRNILNDNLVSIIRTNGPTLVHCRAGKDRTGLVCAIYSLMTGKKMKDVKSRLFYFGFGIGLPTKTKDYYLKIINEFGKVAPKKDLLHNDSLIQLSRSYMDTMGDTSTDPHASYLEPPLLESFAPNLDYSRAYPYEVDYPTEGKAERVNEFSREFFEKNRNKKNPETASKKDNVDIPSVGLYYNGINNTGFNPTNIGGLFYD